MRGHYGYFGITGNYEALARFYAEVRRIWHKWLSRRRQKARLRWDDFSKLEKRFPLPRPVVVHSAMRPVASS